MKILSCSLLSLALAATTVFCSSPVSKHDSKLARQAPLNRKDKVCQSAAQQPSKTRPKALEPIAAVKGKVVRIAIKGNQRVESEVIIEYIKTKPGQDLDPDRIGKDLKNIWDLGLFDDLRVAVDETPEGLVVNYIVSEKPVLGKVFYDGIEQENVITIDAMLEARTGQLATPSELTKKIARVTEYYHQAGFLRAKIDYRTRMFEYGKIDICFLVDEGPKFTVKQIIFNGNQKVASPDLLAAIELQESSGSKPGSIFDEVILSADLMRLNALYYERGMINVRISDPKIDILKKEGHIVITFSIDEGQTFTIGKIEVSGDLVAELKEYKALFEIKTGQTFVRSKVAADMQRIRDFHNRLGRKDLDVSPLTNIDSARQVVDINWQISKPK
jgi:outer membrane protein insertion porin family